MSIEIPISQLQKQDESSDHDSECEPNDDIQDTDFIPRKNRTRLETNYFPTNTLNLFKKRNYRHSSRSARTKTVSVRRQKWASVLSRSDDQIRRMVCCSTHKCLQVVNIPRFRQTMSTVLSSCRSKRRISLGQMLTSAGTFYFDGKHVCSKFLIDGFRFSSELQSSTRMAMSTFAIFSTQIDPRHSRVLGNSHKNNDLIIPHTRNSDFGSNISRSMEEYLSSEVQVRNEDNLTQFNKSIRKDAIVTFLIRLSKATADMMPDNNERHLPCVSKLAVFERFKSEFMVIYPCSSCPTAAYFYCVWKAECSEIKVRKVSRFRKCGTCESLRSEILKATSRNLDTADLLAKKASHLRFVETERREYKVKVELSKLKPREYISIVIDGADQSAYSLPHFIGSVKEQWVSG